MTASTKHQIRVRVTAIQGIPGAEMLTATVLIRRNGAKRRSWIKSQMPVINTLANAKRELASTKKDLKNPAQKAKMDFPRSHQVSRNALMKSTRFWRTTTERAQRMLAQRLRMTAPTGNRRKARLRIINQTGSPNPQAKVIILFSKKVGKKRTERTTWEKLPA